MGRGVEGVMGRPRLTLAQWPRGGAKKEESEEQKRRRWRSKKG